MQEGRIMKEERTMKKRKDHKGRKGLMKARTKGLAGRKEGEGPRRKKGP